MKKANFGCLLLFLCICSAYGHVTSTLHGRDALIPNDFEGSLPNSDYGGRACSGCKKPKDINPTSPSSPLTTSPFRIKPSLPSLCPHFFCQRLSLTESKKMICCPLIIGRYGRIKCPNSCDLSNMPMEWSGRQLKNEDPWLLYSSLCINIFWIQHCVIILQPSALHYFLLFPENK